MPLREWGLGLEQITEYYHKYGLYFTDPQMNNPTSQMWFIDRGLIDQGRKPFKSKGKKYYTLWSPLEIDLIGIRLNNATGDLEEIRLIQCKEKVTPKEANKIIESFVYLPRLTSIMREKKNILTKYVTYVDISPKAEKLLLENKINLLSFKEMTKKFLTTSHILHQIRYTLRPRFAWRPYVFRAYFDTQLLIAESKGKIAHDFRAFFMGHKGSIEAKYTTNKGMLPEALFDEMREAFKRSEEFLDLELKEEDPLLKQKEELHGMIEKATPEQMQKILTMLCEVSV